MNIDILEPVELGSTIQWIRVRGTDIRNPALLLIQQGPGLPMINEARRFGRLLSLEESFTVVYWDQRGCGLSLRAKGDQDTISLEQMAGDTVELLEVLHERNGGPTFVAGFSFGATLGAYAAATRPDLVSAFVAVGTDIDGSAAGANAYDFALRRAEEGGHRRALRQLTAIGPPPHLELKQFTTRVRWATNFGGVTTNATYGSLVRELLASLLRSRDYSIADVIRTVRGISETQAALLSEISKVDLVRDVPCIEVPVVMVQGRLDQVASEESAQLYASVLEAPNKDLVWFEESAHTPHLEEPARFRDILLNLRARVLSPTSAQVSRISS